MESTQHSSSSVESKEDPAPGDRVSLSPAEEAPRIPFLDGIRGVAIILVILHHGNKTDMVCRLDRWFMNFTQSSWMGVDLFFVLSGFLITGILLDTKRSSHYFRSFYARRAVRIFPLYYLTLVFFFFIFQPFFASGNPDVLDLKKHQAWYWTYLSNVYVSLHGTWPRSPYLMHLWSVSIEEQFYMVWPAVVLILSRDRLKFVCLCCIAGSTLLRIVLVMNYAGPVPVYVSSATRLEGLALGALIAAMIRRPEEIGILIRNMRYAGMAGLAVLLGFIVTQGGINMTAIFDESVPLSLSSKLAMTIGLLSVALTFSWFLLLTLMASPRSPVVRVLSTKTLRLFGKYSYCLYLWHAPFVYLLTEKFKLYPRNFPLIFGSQILGQIIFYAVLTGMSLIAAIISWYLFEKQFLKMKRYFPYGTVVEPGRQAPRKDAAGLDRGGVAVAPAGKS